MMNKNSIRQTILNQRQKLIESEQQALSSAWAEIALKFLSDKSFQSISGYYPIRGELNVLPLLYMLKESGKTILLPRTPAKPAPLTFHIYKETNLETDSYGIKQPTVTCPPHTPDIILMPLAACDASGNRIGYGGGYYDRTLEHIEPKPLTIGCAYEFQLVDKITSEAHDKKLDIIITPSRILI